MGLLKIFGVEKKAEDEKTSKKVVVKVKKAGAINPEDDPLNSCNAYVDSSTVNDDEKQYYQEDEYYTYYSYPETMMARRVIPFEERKKTSYPTLNGLYVAEVLLLEYCSYGDYPKPKNGYPGFWWFAYGIRDIGHALESLFNRGFLQWAPKKQYVKTLTVPQLKQILSDEGLSTSGKKADLVDRIMQSISEENLTLPGYTPKYELTNLGQMELEQNGYIPYMHKHKYKTTEDETFGSTFNVWSINRLFPDGDASNWKSEVGKIEVQKFGVNMVGAKPKSKSKDNAVDKSKVREYLKLKEQEIRQGIASPGDGYDEEFKGIQLKKQGRDQEALVQFYIAIGKRFMAPALYTETAKLLHKYKMYEEELSVLEAELKYSVLNTNKKDEVEKRKEKLKQLISEE